MTFEDTVKILDEVLLFLKECGGAYSTITRTVEENVLECLTLGQYVWTGDCFLCYWMIHPEDIESLKERIKPKDIITGSTVYVVECACTGNLRAAIKQLRQSVNGVGVLWHRPMKQDKVYYFPSQKGEERMENGK